MPRLPSVEREIANPYNTLERRLQIQTYDAASIYGKAARAQNAGAQGLARGVMALGDAFESMGKKDEALQEKMMKAGAGSGSGGGGGGGGGGTGAMGSDDRPILDEKGNKIKHPEFPDMTTQQAILLNETYEKDSKKAIEDRLANATQAEINDPKFADTLIGEDKARGRQHLGGVKNSDFVNSKTKWYTEKNMHSMGLARRDFIVESVRQRRAAYQIETQADASEKVFAPQYSDPTANAEEAWKKERASIWAQGDTTAKQKEAQEPIAAKKASAAYLIGRFSFKEAYDILDGKREDQPGFLKGLDKSEVAAVKAEIKQREAEHTSKLTEKLEDLTATRELHGKVDPAVDAEVKSEVNRSQSDTVKLAYAKYTAQTVINDRSQNKTVTDLRKELRDLEGSVESGKRTDAEVVKKEIAVLKTAISQVEKARAEDPFQYAVNAGHTRDIDVDLTSVDALARDLPGRLLAAKKGARANPDMPLSVFKKWEVGVVAEMMKQKPKQFFTKIVPLLGADAVPVLDSIAGKVSDNQVTTLAMTGRMLASNPDSVAARDFIRWQQRTEDAAGEGGSRRAKSLPFRKEKDSGQTDQDRKAIVAEALGKGLANGKNFEIIGKFADAVMAERMEAGSVTFSKEAYTDIINEVAGQTVKHGRKYGGIIKDAPFIEGRFSGIGGGADHSFVGPKDVEPEFAQEVMIDGLFSALPDGELYDARGNTYTRAHSGQLSFKNLPSYDGKQAFTVGVYDSDGNFHPAINKNKDVYQFNWEDIRIAASKGENGGAILGFQPPARRKPGYYTSITEGAPDEGLIDELPAVEVNGN